MAYPRSIAALGMPKTSRLLKEHRLAHTCYAATKRYAERLAFQLGRKVGRETYILRLGEVHGDLQSPSRSVLKAIQQLKEEEALAASRPTPQPPVAKPAAAPVVTPVASNVTPRPPVSQPAPAAPEQQQQRKEITRLGDTYEAYLYIKKARELEPATASLTARPPAAWTSGSRRSQAER